MPSRELRDQMGGDGLPSDGITDPIDSPSLPSGPLLHFDEQMERLVILTVLDDFEAARVARDSRNYGQDAKGATKDFNSWRKDLTDMYFGHRMPKTVPWRFCSNRSLMIGMAIVETLHARIFPAVYNEELTHYRPNDALDIERADRVERLMFWWVRVRAKLREFFDRWVRYGIAYGTVVTESTFDVIEMQKGSKPGPIMGVGPDGQPIQGPPQKVTQPFETTRSDIVPIEDVYLIPGATSIQQDVVLLKCRYLYRDLEKMEQEGKALNISKPMNPGMRCLKDYIVVSGEVGANLPEQQVEELKNVKRRNVLVECVKWHGSFDVDTDGQTEQVRFLACPQYQLYLGGMPISELSQRGIRHIDLTNYMPRLDEPQGLFGLGVLEQVKELSDEIDAIFNQMTDANTLSILRPIFYDPAGDLDAAALNIAPNKATPVSNPSQSVVIPDIRIPTDQLLLAIRMVLEFIERLTAASSYIFGKESEVVGGSGTATRTQAIVGAAAQRFSVPVERLREGAARIITQHLDLLQKNLPPEMEKRILGDDGQPLFGPNELSQDSISGEFDAYLLPDESLGSKESGRMLAQQLYGILTQNLLVMSDPAKIYQVTADVLRSFGKDPELYLGPELPIPMALTPGDEHTLMLQGDFDQVKATIEQNHIEHILAHQAFIQDPGFLQLNPQIQAQVGQFLQMHIQQHTQLMQTLMAASKVGGKQGGTQSGQGNDAGGIGGAPAVGSEPGMGSLENPLSQANNATQRGESGGPQTG